MRTEGSAKALTLVYPHVSLYFMSLGYRFEGRPVLEPAHRLHPGAKLPLQPSRVPLGRSEKTRAAPESPKAACRKRHPESRQLSDCSGRRVGPLPQNRSGRPLRRHQELYDALANLASGLLSLVQIAHMGGACPFIQTFKCIFNNKLIDYHPRL